MSRHTVESYKVVVEQGGFVSVLCRRARIALHDKLGRQQRREMAANSRYASCAGFFVSWTYDESPNPLRQLIGLLLG